MTDRALYLRRTLTIAIALVGVGAFEALSLPLPWLLGPLLACLIAAFAQAPLAGLGKAAPPLRTILGVAVGAAFTPALLYRLDEMAATMAMMVVLIVGIGVVGVPWLHRVCGFDRATSFYGAMPGGLQDMLIFGEEAGGNVRIMSLIHATRIVVIVIAMPLILVQGFGMDLSAPTGAPAAETPLVEMAIMAACALIGWKGGERIGLPGASITGPLFVTAAAALTDLIHQRPPAEAIALAQLAIGVAVGARYVGITFAEFRKVVLSALGYSLLIMGYAGLLAWAAIAAGLVDPASSLLAFAPGGQAEMTVLAIVAGVDAAFVVAHHVFRMVFVIAAAPFAMRLMETIWK